VVWGLVNKVLERIGSGNINVVLYDQSARPEDRFLAAWPNNAQEDPALAGKARNPDDLEFRATVSAGSRYWEVVITPAPGRFGTALSWQPWAVLGAGLVFSLLLATFLEFTRVHAQRMREQAITDPLTGLHNRRYLWEVLKLEFARAKRRRTPISAIMLDIDHFKRINDSFGHEAGDVVLAALGSLLKGNIRGTDVACRLGGEEFVLILPEAPLEFVVRKAEAIRAAFRGLHLRYHGRSVGPVTISLGVAAFPLHADDAESLLGKADEALYQAKRGGRDRVIVQGSGPANAGAAPGKGGTDLRRAPRPAAK
jgi:diguanylate cyclase (GGDEF)-like protein